MTVMAEDQPDARVAAAQAHWANRFVANGTDYADFQATLARISRWDDWCREWGVTAAHYEQLAAGAEDAGHAETAAGAWQRAALAWHWGKFVFVDDPDQQRAAHDHAVACYRKAAPALSPPAQLVRVPYAGTALPAYLRVPATGRNPVVIMVPGLDSTKEELQATAGYFLARGLAVLAVDGPGQGESEYELPIEPAYEKVVTAAVDYLASRDDIDDSRIGLFGVSLGGYYAARGAAYEQRLVATVDLCGPYRWDLDWDDLPPQTRATIQCRSRAASEEEARARAGQLTLEDAAKLITRPLLVVGGGRDAITPAIHQERTAKEAPGAKLVIYPDGGHGVTNLAYESRSLMADWLAGHLKALPQMPRKLRPAGDQAVLVECPSRSDALALTRALLQRPLAGQEDVVPGEATVLVVFAGPVPVSAASALLQEGGAADELAPEPPRTIQVEVVYDGPDLDEVAGLTGLGRDAVARLHAETEWTVAFLGFAPGFAYLAAPHERLRVARRAQPRTRVPAGSVALGGPYSAVYPAESPGGWRLIGRSPTTMWDLGRDPPATLGPGDRVRFTPVRDNVVLRPSPKPPAPAPGAGPAVAGPALLVEQPGFSATIQDAGRPGQGHLGVGRSGAADQGALAQASWLVGNPPGTAAVEIAPGGFAGRARGDLVLAVTGAWVPLTINAAPADDEQPAEQERPAPFRRPFLLRDGEQLRFGPPRAGFRSYLAVRGGLAVAPVLGSRATDVLAGLGPAPLSAGSVIAAGTEESGEVWYADDAPSRPAEPAPAVLPVILGPRSDLFSPAAVDRFLASTWTVGTASNRVGLRLAGGDGPVTADDATELPSEGMAPGSVQVPPSGEPILFLRDHPVTGGYPVIAVVPASALDRAGQLAPGDQLRFEAVPGADAGPVSEVAPA
jgi:KipI family sensor histidine kinase inhibitor